MPEPEPGVSPAPPAKAKGKFGLVIGVLAALALAGGGLYFMMRPAAPDRGTGSNTGSNSPLVLETFVVNLNGGDRAYLRVGITLGLSRPPERNQDQLPIAQVRDTILSVLTAARPDQLTRPEGKNQLKADILRGLKDQVPQLGVEDVYFTEFLVQM